MAATTTPVLAFEAPSGNLSKTKRYQRLRADSTAAFQALNQALVDNGLLAAMFDRKTPTGKLLDHYFMANMDVEIHLEQRAARLERSHRLLLASDALDESQRAAALRAVYGASGPGRDPKLLTDTERQMIEEYRGMSVEQRQMVRTMVRSLSSEGGAR